MSGPIGRGLAAGAVGTTVLNIVTYLDMALRGRAASEAPEKAVDALAGVVGREVPGRGDERQNRRTALGALSGIASGLGIGVGASLARHSGRRLSRPIGSVMTGAAAMAATDLPMAALGLGDPRTWSRADWISDAVPHLAYGMATHAALDALTHPGDDDTATTRPGAGLVVRAAALGAATGARSSLGLSAPILFGRGGKGRRGAALAAVGAEIVADKQPGVPSRLDPPGLPLRFLSGAGGAAVLAHRDKAAPAAPVIAGLAGAAAGSWGGAAWRAWAVKRMPDWQGALVEDSVALTLAVAACLPSRAPARTVRRRR